MKLYAFEFLKALKVFCNICLTCCFVLKETKRQKKTLKKTRKFMVDGVEVSVTTSKIVTDNDSKNEEMRFLRYVMFSVWRGEIVWY